MMLRNQADPHISRVGLLGLAGGLTGGDQGSDLIAEPAMQRMGGGAVMPDQRHVKSGDRHWWGK